MSLDHGILNLPLSKRGDIDAQLDRYKADQRAAEVAARKARATQMRDLKVQAKHAFTELKATPALLDAKAQKLGVTRAKLVTELSSMAKWQPRQLLNLHKQWLGAGRTA